VDLANMVLAGGVPKDVKPSFLDGRLHALTKPDGGVRPIAVGGILRRLVSKVANRQAVACCTSLLQPRQLGVGAKGGCEVAVHTAPANLSLMTQDRAMVKLKFCNAFNSIRRDSVLEAVK